MRCSWCWGTVRAEPCGLAAPRVGVYECSPAVPVDADAAKPGFLRQNAKADRVDGAVFRSPVGSDAVQMTALLAAADFLAGVVADTAVAAGDTDFLAELVPDALNLIGKLLLDHLRVASARASKLAACEVLGQGGLIAALECDNTHLEPPVSGSPQSERRAFFGFGQTLCFVHDGIGHIILAALIRLPDEVIMEV